MRWGLLLVGERVCGAGVAWLCSGWLCGEKGGASLFVSGFVLVLLGPFDRGFVGASGASLGFPCCWSSSMVWVSSGDGGVACGCGCGGRSCPTTSFWVRWLFCFLSLWRGLVWRRVIGVGISESLRGRLLFGFGLLLLGELYAFIDGFI